MVGEKEFTRILFQIRVIMLKTDLLPYDDVADLFIIDPDGFIIRKWNSKQLNNGLMTAEFQVDLKSQKQRKDIFSSCRFQIIQKLAFGQSGQQPKVRFMTRR